MSWLFSRALAEEYLQENSSDGELLRQWSGNPMPQAFLSPDRMTVFFRLSRFGMTFRLLTDDLFEDALMWFLADFPVRTSALPEKAQESTENAPECGSTWRGSLARFDPVSCSWKTAQLSLLEDLEQCSVTWPRSGMTVDGLCLEQATSGRLTCERGYGSWPTPTKSDSKRCADLKLHSLSKRAKEPGAHYNFAEHVAAELDGYPNPEFVELLMGWPKGWTELQPLETGKSRSARQRPGECLQEACE